MYSIKRRKRVVIAGAVVAGAALVIPFGGRAIASSIAGDGASEYPTIPSATVFACEQKGHVQVTILSTPSSHCPAGTTSIKIGQESTAAPAASATFVQQPTQLIDLWTPADPPLTVPTGGKFCPDPPACSGGSVLAGHLGLPAGTWQVTLSAKVNANASTPPAPTATFPQFFVYTQVKNATFTGDAFNVGAGSLDTGTNHDSYYTGSGVITLSAHTELFIYAFGYDSDNGAGSYDMSALIISAVSVPATVTPPTT